MTTLSLLINVMMLAVMSHAATDVVVAQSPIRGLRVELLHDGAHKGLCTETFYSAVADELSKIAQSTAASVLSQHGLSANDFEIEPFHFGGLTVRQRDRSLLRGKPDEKQERDDESEHLSATGEAENKSVRYLGNTYSPTCQACKKTSCSAYCSGCYLCSGNRRDLSDHTANGAGATDAILKETEAALQKSINKLFGEWLTKGPGASLAVGCLGNPKKVQVSVDLV